MSRKKIFLKGFFNKNLGDDLFVKILVERYKNVQFEMYSELNYKKVYNLDNLKIYTNKSFIVILRRIINLFFKIFKVNKVVQIENLKKYDGIIMIGGSLFIEYDGIDYNKYIANQFNFKAPFFIIGANFGPYETEEYLEFHKNNIFNNALDICFRDKYSYNLFKNIKNVRYAPDIVFGLDTRNIEQKEENTVIISVIDCDKDTGKIANKDMYNEKISEFIDYFYKKEYNVILMSFSENQGDERVIQDILKINDNKNKAKTFYYRGNINEALQIIAKAKIIIGNRFHANILGLIFNKTIIPIAYSDKTINTLKDIKFEGKIFDIRKIDEFSANQLNEFDLNYKINVENEKLESKKHFEKIDKFLMEE